MMMTTDQVIEFKEGIGTAAWKMDLWRFAEIIGSDSSHAYTQDKFRQLSALNKALAQFDAETLARIINAEVSV
jgi:hypothetical protein